VNGRVAVSLALAVAVLSAATGCTGSKGDTGKTSSVATTASPPSSTPPSSSSSPPPTPSEIAKNQVVKFLPTYYATLDRLYSNPRAPITDIYQVAVQPESTNEALAIAKFRAAGDRQSGTQHLVKVSDVVVNLAGAGGSSATARYPVVKLTACVDVNGVSVTDAAGKPVGSANRPRYLVENLTVVNIKYPQASGWRVSNAPNKQAYTCGA